MKAKSTKKSRKKSRKHVAWMVDYDYLDKLTDEEFAWLEKFTDEYYRAEFSNDPIHNLSGKTKYKLKYKEKSGTIKQELMQEDNIRRRDVFDRFLRLGLSAEDAPIFSNKPKDSD